MLTWRKQHPALQIGGLELIALPEPFVAWRRRHEDDCVVCIFNMSPKPAVLRGREVTGFVAATELGFVTAPEKGELSFPPYGVALGAENRHR